MGGVKDLIIRLLKVEFSSSIMNRKIRGTNGTIEGKDIHWRILLALGQDEKHKADEIHFKKVQLVLTI